MDECFKLTAKKGYNDAPSMLPIIPVITVILIIVSVSSPEPIRRGLEVFDSLVTELDELIE